MRIIAWFRGYSLSLGSGLSLLCTGVMTGPCLIDLTGRIPKGPGWRLSCLTVLGVGVAAGPTTGR